MQNAVKLISEEIKIIDWVDDVESDCSQNVLKIPKRHLRHSGTWQGFFQSLVAFFDFMLVLQGSAILANDLLLLCIPSAEKVREEREFCLGDDACHDVIFLSCW